MNALDVASTLRRCVAEVGVFTPDTLAEFFALSARQFVPATQPGPIVFHTAGDGGETSALLRGAIFWQGDAKRPRRIVRGLPRIYPTSDYALDRLQIAQEPILAQAALGGEVFVEPKVYGATIRVYSEARELYCATDVSHDGGNPLVGAGIDNSRVLGIDYGSQAARILLSRYPKIERLTRLGYVTVFVLHLPEFAPDQSIDRADMILVDVIDPDYYFADRLEKERIAEDHGLNVVDLVSRISVPTAEILPLLRRCRALEHQPSKQGAAGYIMKGRLDEVSDQMFVRIEPPSERDRTRDFTTSDLTAVVDEITDQLGPAAWTDLLFAEDLMLEYLGTRHRTARWKVQEYLAAWQTARRTVGLPG